MSKVVRFKTSNIEQIPLEKHIYFIGIDPGKTGSIAICDNYNNSYSFFSFVLKNNELDANQLYLFLSSFNDDLVVCYIEDVHSIFGMSAKSNFSFGKVYGKIIAVLECLNFNHNFVQPKEWQKEMHKDIEKNKDKKLMSLMAARKLFPTLELKRTPRCTVADHNLVDSLLICEYGKRKYYENRINQ